MHDDTKKCGGEPFSPKYHPPPYGHVIDSKNILN